MPINLEQADLVTEISRQIISQAGMANMPADKLEEYKERLSVEIQRRIGLISLKMLDQKGREKMKLWTENAKTITPVDTVKFFQDNIPDYEQKLAQYLEEFAQGIIKDLKG
ncbi:MAG: hypothetical protein ABH896_03995 [Candidatus Jacksonbacteria bacterium]